MRKRIRNLIFRITGGHLVLYAKPTALFGERLVVVEREQYELILAQIQLRWVRGFMLAMALLVIFTVAAFFAGTWVAWTSDEIHFVNRCARILSEYCPEGRKNYTSPFLNKNMVGPTPVIVNRGPAVDTSKSLEERLPEEFDGPIR